MSKYLPSSASNNTSLTKVNNKSETIKYDIDDLDNVLCPPALSPYALSILDDRIHGKNKGKSGSGNNANGTSNMGNDKSEKSSNPSKPNTMTSLTFNEITKSSKLTTTHINTNQTTINNINSATNTSISRHSKFMKKLNLGAPRRLTNDGDFQVASTRKSIESLSQIRIIDQPSQNDLRPELRNINPKMEIPKPTFNTDHNHDKENRMDNVAANDKERKHSLQFTPKKYSPLHKRTTIELNSMDMPLVNNVVDTPIRNRHDEVMVDSPEVARRAVQISVGSNATHNVLQLFGTQDTQNEFVLDLDQIPNKKKTQTAGHPKSESSSEQFNDFSHVQSLLDKKKEIHLLKQEIKQYRAELLKQQQLQQQQHEENQKSKEQKDSTEDDKLLEINKHKYKIFEQIGKGGSSKVFRASVVDSPHRYLAIKIVNLEDQELSTIAELKGEIKILHKLRHCPRVVRLLDYSLTSKVIFFVMECGDLDLATVLSNRHLMPRYYDLEFIRYHAQEMIKCINAIHEMDVVHLDLKPANFVFVSGVLKLIDFGISNSIKGHTVNVYREYQMGTPNYMAPETLLDCAESENGNSIWKVGKPADIWSLGCILYQLTYGSTPYASYTGTKKILAITNPSINISYPVNAVNLRKKSNNGKKEESEEKEGQNEAEDIKVCPYLIDMIRKCLIRDPTKRITGDELRKCVFINPVVVDKAVIKEVVRGCVGFGGRHPELKNVALGTMNESSKDDQKAQDRLERLIDGVWKRVSGEKIN